MVSQTGLGSSKDICPFDVTTGGYAWQAGIRSGTARVSIIVQHKGGYAGRHTPFIMCRPLFIGIGYRTVIIPESIIISAIGKVPG